MELRHLATFVAVAEEASFSRAGERLQLVQSAVSATIKALEDEWGTQLFHRTSHHVRLSAAGRTLLPEARIALRAAEAVEQAVEETRGGLRGTVRVGILQAMQRPGSISVAAALAAFKKSHPGVSVEVVQGASADHAEAVRGGDLDLAFVATPDRSLPQLTLRPIVDVEMRLACHKGHRLASRKRVRLADVDDEAFADLPPTWGARVATDRAFAAAGLTRQVEYEVNDVATIIDLVRHGLAIAILAPVSAVPDPEVVWVTISGPAPSFMIGIVAAVDGQISPAARAFADTVLDAAPN